MAVITLSLPPDVEAFVRSVALARGESDEEFLRQHLIEAASRYAALKDELQKGMDSLSAGNGIPGEEVFAALRSRADGCLRILE